MNNLKISIGKSRFDKHWKNTEISWVELKKKLKEPYKTNETVAEYSHFSKQDKDRVKDVGGFVGGHLKNGSRKAENVLTRSMLTLDIDYATTTFWDDLIELYDFTCLIYSTHSSTENKPRLRLIVPLSREVSPDEYEAVSRKVADMLNIELFDITTYQASRLMYWPSTPSDGKYIYEVQDGEVLNPDEVLNSYPDWTDTSYWPQSSKETEHIHKNNKRLGDPQEKPGIIGAFCRAYSVSEAIDTFLADVYESTHKEDRYTYINGTTASGLVLYDDLLAYSNHSTDPANDGSSHNAFDLVRIHKFRDLDDSAKADTPINKLPSYLAMVDFARKDEKTSQLIGKERFQEAQDDFSEIDLQSTDKVYAMLEKNKNGVISSIGNVVTILENDPNLKGIFAYNEFEYRDIVLSDLPWRKIGIARSDEALRDRDDANLRLYMEKIYGLTGEKKIKDGLGTVIEKNRIHPVRDYLDGCVWDGVARVDSILIDYLGAADTPYTRAVTRKTLCGAVARIYRPGVKFDTMLTLCGPQGIGKSTIFNRLGGKWYSDSLTAVSGKESYEQLQGCWIMEIGELSAMKKAETEAIKNYLSKCEDRYRQAYASRSEAFPRQTIFIGTTNQKQFLKDETGNRRFWVVDVSGECAKDLFKELTPTTVKQIWAEAKEMYQSGEQLFLSKEEELSAREAQEQHAEEDSRLGLIKRYLEMELPPNWNKMNLYERQQYVDSYNEDEEHQGYHKRNRVCAMEVWCELFGRNKADLEKFKSKEIRAMLKTIDGWEDANKNLKFPSPYNAQKGFIRTVVDDDSLPF